MVRIAIYVQSVDYSISRNITDSNKAKAFVSTMTQFYKLITQDFNRSAAKATFHLQETYTCDQIKISATDTALNFDLECSSRRLISLQCDQSSGQLATDLQQCLVTGTMLYQLRVHKLNLGVDVQNQTWYQDSCYMI